MYKALVRSHLDYCDVIYHIPHTIHLPPLGLSLNTLMEKVEKIQYQAALAVTGAWQGSNRVKLYEEVGWESLSDRRMCKRLLQIHKIVDGRSPNYLRDKMPRNRRNLANLPTVFHEIACRTDRYSNSFFPNGTSDWNNIITNFEYFPSFNEFKNHLISLVRPVIRSTFDIHDPTFLRYLFQLRVGLSPLRHHKKRHSFVDTPSDKCLCKEGIEDATHFLLFCPFYFSHREKLISQLRENLRKNILNPIINTELCLYGHASLNHSDNRKILVASLEYIKCSNRFTT